MINSKPITEFVYDIENTAQVKNSIIKNKITRYSVNLLNKYKNLLTNVIIFILKGRSDFIRKRASRLES